MANPGDTRCTEIPFVKRYSLEKAIRIPHILEEPRVDLYGNTKDRKRERGQTGADQIGMKDSFMFRVYRRIFPLFLGFARLDRLLSDMKGVHILAALEK